MDIAMPRMTGLQATRDLVALKPGVRVLMLTMHVKEQYFFPAGPRCVTSPSCIRARSAR
jgi:DNA-binding NarL/FixJ family response regulator